MYKQQSIKQRSSVHPYVEKRIKTLGIKEGMTIVDYGCGPGRYTLLLAQLVGEQVKVIALDMFFMIEKPTEFLKELYRILKKNRVLIIDDGHQSRKKTLKKIMDSGILKITEERKDSLLCMKV